MRIVLLNDDVLPTARGGAAVVVDWLRRELVMMGHEVVLVTTRQDDDTTPMHLTADDVGEIVSIHSRYPLEHRHARCVINPQTEAPLRLLLQRMRPDVVHAHNVHTHLSYRSLLLAREVTDRVFLTAHDTFLVSFRRVGGEAYLEAASRGRPYRMGFMDHLRAAGRRYRPLRNPAIRKTLAVSETKVVAISDAVGEFLRNHGIDPAATIRNGVAMRLDPPGSLVEEFRRKHGLTGPTVLFAGRVSRDKGIGALLAAMETVVRKLPSAQILVAGEREAAEPFLARAHPEVRGAARVLGWLPAAEMPLAFAAADAVATPSLYLDNFPTVNLEAMAAGKPVVGTRFGGTPEAVVDGQTGFVVDPRDASAFSARLLLLLSDPELRARMGAEGRDRARKEFTLRKMAMRYLDLYRAPRD